MTGWLFRKLAGVILRRATNEALRQAYRDAERRRGTGQPMPHLSPTPGTPDALAQCPLGYDCPGRCLGCQARFGPFTEL